MRPASCEPRPSGSAELGFSLGMKRPLPLSAWSSPSSTTTRPRLSTVRGHPVTDFLFGGLNYQIEHHLLPALPRCNLPKAQKIVKRHCSERDLSYYETGPFRSYWEVLCELHKVSAPVRAGSRR